MLLVTTNGSLIIVQINLTNINNGLIKNKATATKPTITIFFLLLKTKLNVFSNQYKNRSQNGYSPSGAPVGGPLGSTSIGSPINELVSTV